MKHKVANPIIGFRRFQVSIGNLWIAQNACSHLYLVYRAEGESTVNKTEIEKLINSLTVDQLKVIEKEINNKKETKK